MRRSIYIVCPSVLSWSNLKLHQTLEVKNIFKQENIVLQLTWVNVGFFEKIAIQFPTEQPDKHEVGEERDRVLDDAFGI